MKIEWLKLARRGAMAAIVACCVVGLTGCDEDDVDLSLGVWEITAVSDAWEGDGVYRLDLDTLDFEEYGTSSFILCAGGVVDSFDMDDDGNVTIDMHCDTKSVVLTGSGDDGGISGTFTVSYTDGRDPIDGTFTGEKVD